MFFFTLAWPPTSSSLEMIAAFIIIHLVSRTKSLSLFINLILVTVPPFPFHLFLRPLLLSLFIHHFAYP